MTQTIDISSAVTKEQYDKVLSSLLRQFAAWREENGWCTELYRYVAQLSDTFTWVHAGEGEDDDKKDDPDDDGYMTVSYPAERTGEEMAADLRAIRGRILQFTIDPPSDYYNLDKANEFLAAAGLPQCAVVSQVFEVQIANFDVQFSGGDEDLKAAIRKALLPFSDNVSVTAYEEDDPVADASERVPLLPGPQSP